MDAQDPVPGAVPVTDRRPTPAGVLPRRFQTWVMAGLAAGILLIILLAGEPRPPAGPAQTPAPQAPTADRLRDYQERLRAMEARAATEATQPAVDPSQAFSGEPPAPRAYDNTIATVTKISGELHLALDAAKRRQLRAEPKFLAGLSSPCLAPIIDGETPANAVAISSGFVDLLNHLAHAKALDESVSGYFEQYVSALSKDDSAPLEPVGKALPNEQVWSFDTMNHQVSLFNQMAGTLLAIDMAHHYLGHSKKHGATLSADGNAPEPFTEKVSEKEWREAVLKGARNSLDCGLGVDGFRTILTAVEKLPARPKWSACLVHPKADTSKLNRELEKLEKDYFLVEK